MTRVLLVAAYATARAGLFALLTSAHDCVVVGQASGSGDLACLLPGLRPDVVLLDALPGEADRILALLAGGTTALVLLGDDPNAGRRLLQSNLPGRAWLRKDSGGDEIAAAVRAVTVSLAVADPAFLGLLMDGAPPARTPALSGETPTPREREVLQLMAQGLPNKQIAARLGISLHTVKFHVAALLSKLNAASRTEAVTQGMRKGWVLL